jgi:hypothetical protein
LHNENTHNVSKANTKKAQTENAKRNLKNESDAGERESSLSIRSSPKVSIKARASSNSTGRGFATVVLRLECKADAAKFNKS